MRRLVLLFTMAGLISCLIFVVVGATGLRIFPCEAGYTESGDVHDGEGPPHELRVVSCQVASRFGTYTGTAAAMMVGLFGVLPCLLALWPAIRLARSDKSSNAASRVLGIISVAGGAIGLVSALMAPNSFSETSALPLLLAMIVGVIAAILSRGAERMAVGGVLGSLLVVLVVSL